MKGLCSLEIDGNRLRGLIVEEAAFRKVDEFFLELKDFAFFEGIKKNIDKIEKLLEEEEEKHSLEIERLFVNLPFDKAEFLNVEDVVPLSSRRKKVTLKDIERAKKYIENIVLDWKKYSLHHIILRYETDNNVYFCLPSDLEAKNLKLRSFLVYIERREYEEMLEVFNNIERKFAGFIWEPISTLSIGETLMDKVSILMKENYTLCTGIKEGEIFVEKFPFGEKDIKRAIQEKFFVSYRVAEKLFQWYVCFDDVSGKDRMITIKDKENYVKIPEEEFLFFIKEVLLSKIEEILYFLEKKVEENTYFFFLGNVFQKKNFTNFLKKEISSLKIKSFSLPTKYLSLYGCIRYGYLRYLERFNIPKISLWQKVLNIYQGYF
ncbi:MAG: hypothetical protein B6D56_03010 [Candidatus Omnitrophica bacterium 4484_70.1]|nr:MAG: hypothetical protein B6D56_03010 [Candidatus Omnitrophica bacterium 4484_70.1]